MQSQNTVKSLCSRTLVTLQSHFVQLVIIGSILLLATIVIVWELHMAGHTHLLNMFQRIAVQPDEGPIDSINTHVVTLF